MENLTIKRETNEDHERVFEVIEQAFREEELSDHNEHYLVERLRKSDAFVPELSLVAESDGCIVGHILLTEITISGNSTPHKFLALAPISVLPEYQGKGIGSKLIDEAHTIADRLGYSAIVLVGHAEYYPRFGYVKASNYGIKVPFDAPDDSVMVKPLKSDVLKNTSGVVHYDKAFFE